MTKDVSSTIDPDGADRKPCVPPGVLTDTMIFAPVLTLASATVTVPATSVAVPLFPTISIK